MTVSINEQQSIDLDLILQKSIDNEGQVYSIDEIHETLFTDQVDTYCLNLFYILNSHYPTLLWPTDGPTPECFWANDYAKAFLHNGGFKKIYQDEHKRVTEQRQVDVLNLEKLTAEVEIVRFQKGLGKRLTIWGFAVAIISVVASVVTTLISNPIKTDNKGQHSSVDTFDLNKQLQSIKARLKNLESRLHKDTLQK